MATEGAIIPQLVESITQSSSPSSTATTCSVTMAGGDISSSAHSTIPCHTEVVLDEKTKKELFTDTFCRVCGAVLQFEAHRNAHYEGKRHAQKVRLYFLKQELEELTYKKKQKGDHVEFHVDKGLSLDKNRFCSLCNMVLSSPADAESHYIGKIHAKRSIAAAEVEKGLSLDKNRFCSLCNMVFSSPVVAQSHYIGKIHAKKLKQTTGEQNEWSLSLEENAQSETAVTESNDTLSPLTEKSNQQDASEDLSCADNAIDLSDPNKYCKLCCASFNKPLVAQQHYNGKKHARNEVRRKMMEAMGDTGVPMDSGGDGIFVCPICNITLTSIEMYQSHMQGNKHQIKETMVANVMRTTKKSYDSFQDELADYIKVQKARGLEPKTQLRQNKDQSDSCEEEEPVPAPIHPKANPVVPYKYPPPPPPPHPMPYPAYGPHHPPHPRLAGWDKPYWPQKPMPKLPSKAIPHRKHPRSSPDSSSESSSSDESSGSYKKEKRHKREHRSKERKHHSKSRRENGSSERKKRKTEDSDSGKDEGEREKKNEEVSADKSKHRKDKKKKEESSADKDSKKHKKTKKNVDQRTEEELLWDESILGF